MTRSLLLVLLASWATVVPLSALRCGTGVAHPGETLSVPHSLLHADVALLKAYRAADVDECTSDCCTQKFGSCTVVTYSRTSRAGNNCRHFNCRPITKCRFTSSNTTDSFSYSSSPSSYTVPSGNAFDSSPSSPTAAPTPPNDPALDQQVSHGPDRPTGNGESSSANHSQSQEVTSRSDQQNITRLSESTNQSQKPQFTNVPDPQTSISSSESNNGSQKPQFTNVPAQQISTSSPESTNRSPKPQLTNVTDQHISNSTSASTNLSQKQRVTNVSDNQTSNSASASINQSQSQQDNSGSDHQTSTIRNLELTNQDHPVTHQSDYHASNDSRSEWSSTTGSGQDGADTQEAAASSGIKPRKGVNETDQFSEDLGRKGVKPRKGVSLDGGGLNDTESNIKPRKGVGTNTPTELQRPSAEASKGSTEPSSVEASHDDLMASALAGVFEDEPSELTSASVTSASKSISSSVPDVVQSSSVSLPTLRVAVDEHSTTASPRGLQSSRSSAIDWTEVDHTTTPHQWTTRLPQPSTTRPPPHHSVEPSKTDPPSIYEHSRLLFNPAPPSTEASTDGGPGGGAEADRDRKYQASMHLVLSLVFGLLVLFVVLGVVAKRVYDGWLRRHYRRMDFLIDGMYNGYE